MFNHRFVPEASRQQRKRRWHAVGPVIRLRDGDVELGPGELFVVPVGVEHQPVAIEEAELLLIEPTGTPNTGDPSTAARRVEI